MLLAQRSSTEVELKDATGQSVGTATLTDDLKTDAPGNSGDQIACGVIVK